MKVQNLKDERYPGKILTTPEISIFENIDRHQEIDRIIRGEERIGYWDGPKKSWNDIKRNTNQLMTAFLNMELKKGDHILYSMNSMPDIVSILWAADALGIVAHGINPKLIKDCPESMLQGKSYKIKAACINENYYEFTKPELDKFNVEHRIIYPVFEIASEKTKKEKNYNRDKLANKIRKEDNHNILFSFELEQINQLNFDDMKVSYSEGQPSMAIPTTGSSTGTSKIVLLGRDGINNMVEMQRIETLTWGPGSRMLVPFPPMHVTVAIHLYQMAMANNAAIYCMYEFTPNAVFNAIYNSQCTQVFLPSQMLAAFVHEIETMSEMEIKTKLKYLKTIILGGEPLHKALAIRSMSILGKYGIQVMNNYGMSELSAMSHSANELKNNPELTNEVGIDVPFTKSRIVDEDNNPIEYGKEGNLEVFTPARFLNYLDNEELTQITVTEDNFIKTGDISTQYLMNGKKVTKVGGRKSDSFEDKNKIRHYLFHVDNKIGELEEVAFAKAVNLAEPNEDPIVVLHATFDLRYNAADTIQKIAMKCSTLPIILQPKLIKIREYFARHVVSDKVDFVILRTEKDGYIYYNIKTKEMQSASFENNTIKLGDYLEDPLTLKRVNNS